MEETTLHLKSIIQNSYGSERKNIEKHKIGQNRSGVDEIDSKEINNNTTEAADSWTWIVGQTDDWVLCSWGIKIFY